MRCQECKFDMKSTRLIQMKIPGTANTYKTKDRRKVCAWCRKKPGYRGRFRLLYQ